MGQEGGSDALAAVLAAVGAVLAIPEEAWRSYQNAGGTLGRPALFAAMAVAGAGAGIIQGSRPRHRVARMQRLETMERPNGYEPKSRSGNRQ